MKRDSLYFLFCLLLNFHSALASEESNTTRWDLEHPPGPHARQSIDTDEGTWINLDVNPDGTELVFDLLGDIYTLPLTASPAIPNDQHESESTTTPRRIAAGVAWDMQPRYSPDGEWIAFTSDRIGSNGKAGDNIWIMRRDGTDPRQVTQETYRLLNNPTWSPDGSMIVARKHFTSRRSLGAGEMWMYHRAASAMNASGGIGLTQRPNDQKDVNEPVFSRDGRYLYYSQDTTPGSTFEYDKDSNGQIYVVKRLDLQTGETEDYITGPGGACRPQPSPDGKTIAFVRRVGSKTGLHLLDIQTGAIRLVYDQLERDMQEAWAIHGVYPGYAWMPDGASIVIWARGKIRRIDVSDGSESIIPFRVKDERKITRRVRFPIKVGEKTFPVKMLRWVTTSPDGNQVTFQALGYLWIKDLPDGEPRRLTNQTEQFEFYPSYSRDSKYLTYVTWNDEQLGAVRVASVATAGGQENWKVTEHPGHYVEPVFSPDGQQIVYRKSSGGRLLSPLWSRETGIYRVASRGGQPERITKSGREPQFAAANDRVFYQNATGGKDADNLGLHSIGLDGKDDRQHFNSQWATRYAIAPNGQWIAFIERFHVYLAPFIRTGNTVEIGPKSNAIPIVKVSQEAGDWIHFSGDSKSLHWALGADRYSISLEAACAKLLDPSRTPGDEHEAEVQATPDDDEAVVAANDQDDNDDQEARTDSEQTEREPMRTPIGFTATHDEPKSVYALVGGRIITMREANNDDENASDSSQGVIEDGTIVVRGNRIEAMGRRDEVKIPNDATVIRIPGQVVLPGFVDTHAHGSQASQGITPQANWVDYARLAFGVTTIHDPSNDTHEIFAASEMTKAGQIVAPRTFSTGTILYGATGSFRAEIASLDDARFHLRRMKAVGAFSVKSYNQPRRDQRQQVVAAARELEMMVVPEGGSTFMHNMTMIVDGHTGIEHTLPVQTAYDDVMDLWRGTEVGYTPTLSVAYGGISGERYWYEVNDLWRHPRLQRFIPPHILVPRSRRRQKAPIEDYNHIKVAQIAQQVVAQGGLAQAGGHGQLNGICTHWEMWSFVQGGMTPLEALRCGTLYGAKYLGLDGDLGSLETGKLADLVVIEQDYDPTRDVQDSQRIQWVMANGRLYDAKTMAAYGSEKAAPKFYFHGASQLIGHGWPAAEGCGCSR